MARTKALETPVKQDAQRSIFPFLSLPAELRENVYDFLFPTPTLDALSSRPRDVAQNLDNMETYRQILQALHICQQIRKEVIAAVFGRKTFRIDKEYMQPFFERIPPDGRAALTSMHIDMTWRPLRHYVDFKGSCTWKPIYRVPKTRETKNSNKRDELRNWYIKTPLPVPRYILTGFSKSREPAVGPALTEMFSSLKHLSVRISISSRFERAHYGERGPGVTAEDVLSFFNQQQVQWLLRNRGLQKFHIDWQLPCQRCVETGTVEPRQAEAEMKIMDAVLAKE